MRVGQVTLLRGQCKDSIKTFLYSLSVIQYVW